MALELLGVALWLVLAVAGAWLLVTGRDTFCGLPLGFNDVRIRRLFGLFCMLAAAFFIYRISQGSLGLWPVIGLYGGLAFSAVLGWWKARDARA
jgi:hypothetical protein